MNTDHPRQSAESAQFAVYSQLAQVRLATKKAPMQKPFAERKNGSDAG